MTPIVLPSRRPFIAGRTSSGSSEVARKGPQRSIGSQQRRSSRAPRRVPSGARRRERGGSAPRAATPPTCWPRWSPRAPPVEAPLAIASSGRGVGRRAALCPGPGTWGAELSRGRGKGGTPARRPLGAAALVSTPPRPRHAHHAFAARWLGSSFSPCPEWSPLVARRRPGLAARAVGGISIGRGRRTYASPGASLVSTSSCSKGGGPGSTPRAA